MAKVATTRRISLRLAAPRMAKLLHGASPRTPRSLRHRDADRTPPAKTLLWIDDYAPALLMYQAIFEKQGFRVLITTRPSVGLQLAFRQNVDAVITDYEMPEMSGGSVAIALKRSRPELPVILFSGSASLPRSITSLADGHCDKAAPIERLIATVKRLVQEKPTSSSLLHPVLPLSEQTQRVVA